MNIEATKTASGTNNTSEAKSVSTSQNTAEKKTTFKEELNSVKNTTQEQVINETVGETKKETKNIAKNATKPVVTPKETKIKDEHNVLKHPSNDDKEPLVNDPLNALSSKIATINLIKNTKENVIEKTSKTKHNEEYCAQIKMDNEDTTFFLNLVQNQQMNAQSAQANSADASNKFFTEIKNTETQQSVQVSATLLSAMNEAAKTGKSFRIDFDKDVAVVMKLDRHGKISANFIPGDAAVENYLRNNIAALRQSFDNQNIAYNELTYSKNQKQEQEKQNSQREKNKENENE